MNCLSLASETLLVHKVILFLVPSGMNVSCLTWVMFASASFPKSGCMTNIWFKQNWRNRFQSLGRKSSRITFQRIWIQRRETCGHFCNLSHSLKYWEVPRMRPRLQSWSVTSWVSHQGRRKLSVPYSQREKRSCLLGKTGQVRLDGRKKSSA